MAQIAARVQEINEGRLDWRTWRLTMPASVAQIVRSVASDHGLKPADLLGGRKPYHVRARRDAMRAVHTLARVGSRPPRGREISRWFGRNTMTTCLALGWERRR